ncbi:MAG: hypothetical protein WC992_02290 [Acholeplasmataceae bacterium]
MSKKNSVVLNEKAVVEVMDTAVQIDMDDVINVQIADYEQLLQAREIDLSGEQKTVDRQISETAAAIQERVTTDCEAALSTKADKVFLGLRAVYPRVVVTISGRLTGDTDDLQVTGTMQFACYEGAKEQTASQIINIPNQRVSVSSSLKTLLRKQESQQELAQSIRQRRADVRVDITRLPMAERQLRAELSRLRLRNSDGGKLVLETMRKAQLRGLPTLQKLLA